MAVGFRDKRGWYVLANMELQGVFVSDDMLDENEGATSSEVMIAIDIPTEGLGDFEIVERKGLREWCVPAAALNTLPYWIVTEQARETYERGRSRARYDTMSPKQRERMDRLRSDFNRTVP
jgi:hypothetical protein